MRTIVRRLPNACIAVLASASAYACRDATAPAPAPDTSRYYRLQPLSIPASGFVATDGDLLLSADGTYATGLRDGLGSFDVGRWSGSGSDVTLTSDGSSTTLRGRSSGDTVRITGAGDLAGASPVLTFIRAPLAANPLDGTRWVLRSVNGRTATNAGGIVLVDTSEATNGRFVARVAYDTLAFSARRFVRRSRADADSSISSRFGVSGGASDYSTYGGVDAAGSTVVLRLYGGDASVVAADSLRIAGDTLVRRSRPGFGTAVEEDRYVRLP